MTSGVKPKYTIRIDFQDSTKAFVSPELLWHAPEGREYLVQLLDDGGAWNFSHNCEELSTKDEATKTAFALWNARERQTSLRVVRVCRWTGQGESILIHSIVKFWGQS